MWAKDQRIATFKAMFDGYVDALNRFDAAVNTADPVKTYVPLFEALNWAYVLDDRTARYFAPDGKGKPLGWGWRKRIPNADIMDGVRFARNSVQHKWSDALRLENRGGISFEWVWRSADELPVLDRAPYARGAQCYREQMQGQAAGVCLDVLGGVFFTLKGMLEPHTILRAPPGHLPIAEDAHDDDSGFPPSL
jgi:hypothetical protein